MCKLDIYMLYIYVRHRAYVYDDKTVVWELYRSLDAVTPPAAHLYLKRFVFLVDVCYAKT